MAPAPPSSMMRARARFPALNLETLVARLAPHSPAVQGMSHRADGKALALRQ